MSNLQDIAAFFDTEYPLNKEGVTELLSSFRTKHITKGNLLLSHDSKESSLRFLNSGVVREYYQTERGDININFYTEPQFITDLSSFVSDTPTEKNQQALTPVELLEIGKSRFEQLLAKYHCGQDFINQSFKKLLRQKEKHEYKRLTQSPESLYRDLLVNKVDWLQKVPQYHLASYLNVTPETLSRIRNRIS